MLTRVFIVVCVFLVAGTDAQSRRWFSPEMNCWITHQKVPALWEDAQRRCERDGAVLASPLNMQLFNYMQSLIDVKNHSAAYFIGTRAKHSDDGQEVLYMSVEEVLPVSIMNAEWSKLANNTGNSVLYFVKTKRELFVFDKAVPALISTPGKTTDTDVPSASTKMSPKSTSVPATSTRVPSTSTRVPATSTTVPATGTKMSVTSTSAPTTSSSASTTSTTTPLSSSSTFPPGYTYYSATGSYYKLHHDMEKSWYDANATCASEGAYLTVLNDAEEADIIRRIVRDAVGDYEGTWLGLRDSLPAGVSDWRTVHGESLREVFHEWYEGRPYNDERYTYKCGLFSTTSKKLFDRPCSDYLKWYFTCERSQ